MSASGDRSGMASPMSPGGGNGPEDPANDPRMMRRIFAEDPQWNMAAVPSLVQLCFDHLVKNYGQRPVLSELNNSQFKDRLVDNLNTDLPLEVTAGIENEDYWRRKVECMSDDWGPCVVGDHGGSWKRLYFERHLQSQLENCTPEDEGEAMDRPGGIVHTCELSGGHIKKLNLRQLIPPEQGEPEQPRTISIVDDDDGDAEDDEEDDALPTDHIDLTPVLRKLQGLEELRLSYLVKNCGMNFKWSMFGINSGDCSTLMRSVRDYTSLTSLTIHRSLVGDHKARIICSYLLNHKTIKRLDLSHNSIADSGARALAKLINHSLLEELNVCDNKIKAKGAKALGKSLKENSRLRELNVRLNRFDEAGGKLFFQGLTGNRTLQKLNVSCNSLGLKSATAMCEYIDHNPGLTHLDLTCNDLGVDAGTLVLEAMDGNTALQNMDIRLTKFDKDTEFQINVIMRSNSKAAAPKAS